MNGRPERRETQHQAPPSRRQAQAAVSEGPGGPGANHEKRGGTELEETLELERTRVPAFIWLIAALALVAIFTMILSNGVAGASTLHELFHDARHFIGVPCH